MRNCIAQTTPSGSGLDEIGEAFLVYASPKIVCYSHHLQIQSSKDDLDYNQYSEHMVHDNDPIRVEYYINYKGHMFINYRGCVH